MRTQNVSTPEGAFVFDTPKHSNLTFLEIILMSIS